MKIGYTWHYYSGWSKRCRDHQNSEQWFQVGSHTYWRRVYQVGCSIRQGNRTCIPLFFTLSWRFWGNHPVSVASSVYERLDTDADYEKIIQNNSELELVKSDSDSDIESNVGEGSKLNNLLKHKQHEVEATRLDVPETALLPEAPHPETGWLWNSDPDHAGKRFSLDRSDKNAVSINIHSGLTFMFYIRCTKGVTTRLSAESGTRVPVMIVTLYHSLPIEHPTTYKHIVCMTGGAGISTVLPILRIRVPANSGRIVVYWGYRSPGLVREVGVDRLSGVGIDVHILVGEWWEFSNLVARKTRGSRAIWWSLWADLLVWQWRPICRCTG